MSKVVTEKVNGMVPPKKKPTYEFHVEEGMEDISPSKRKIAKTMEITETFTMYDALKYVMQMEKAVEDKKAEIEGLESMIKAYRDEIEDIEKVLKVTKADEEWNKEKHRKLKEEEVQKLVDEKKKEDDDNLVTGNG